MKSSANNLVLERGILTSSYKQEIRRNIRSMRAQSLSKIKSSVKGERSKFMSETATAIRVSMFVVVLLLIVF